jgi:GTP-binding protein LepA
MMSHIRNFSIIAHIDHGKSTLADRMLEATGTIEKRRMREQVLDQMALERERGITIKMAPVRMRWQLPDHAEDGEYILNLIDTPGHIDFSYEVSRSLRAVEGAVLLVDATQGVEAQTLTTLGMAREQGLTIIPVVNKIDSPLARIAETRAALARITGCADSEILETSGKTGAGVEKLLAAIVARVPSPVASEKIQNTKYNTQITSLCALIFDFEYSEHQGVILYARIFDGCVRAGDTLRLVSTGHSFAAREVGFFAPELTRADSLSAGEIGYVVTGIKEPGIAAVGDTLTALAHPAQPLQGYAPPRPVVWASLYPENQGDFPALARSLARLRLSDSSLSYDEEHSETLGRGFRSGFLGMLHLEIVAERLRREFSLALILTSPTVTYRVTAASGAERLVHTPSQFPDEGAAREVFEPWARARIILPQEYLGALLRLLHSHEALVGDSETFDERRVCIAADLPLRELMRGFFDALKSATAGYASLSYEQSGERPASVARLDIAVAEEVVPALSRVVGRARVEEEAREAVERLYAILPRQLFVTKIQARALGRIIASRTLPALRKDVTAKLYGGDVTRKMKLLEKQKKGKKKMRERGRVSIPHEVFLKMVKR